MTESKSEVVSLRFSPDELAELKQQADERCVAVSKHAHACALDGMRRQRPGVTVRRLDSGGELTTGLTPIGATP